MEPNEKARKEEARWTELIRPLAEKRLEVLSQMSQITRAVGKSKGGWATSGYSPAQYEDVRAKYKEIDDQIKELQEAAATGADPILYKLQGKQEEENDGTDDNASPY